MNKPSFMMTQEMQAVRDIPQAAPPYFQARRRRRGPWWPRPEGGDTHRLQDGVPLFQAHLSMSLEREFNSWLK